MSSEYGIRNEGGHYVVYVNGQFYGSYDTIYEAAKDVDSMTEAEMEDGD